MHHGPKSGQWDHLQDTNGDNLATVFTDLLGIDPRKELAGVRIRPRMQKPDRTNQNLYWNSTIKPGEFYQRVYYQIDELDIDVFLRNMVSCND